MKRLVLTLLSWCVLSSASDATRIVGILSSNSTQQAAAQRRVRFRIKTIAEESQHRKVLSDAMVDGPPATDFFINLNSGGFELKARFLTDLIDAKELKIRATLETRRLRSYSESRLPLYEIDSQEQAIQLGFDEDLVLLPFGSAPGSNKLMIEITPSWSDLPARDGAGLLLPVKIDISKILPGGLLNIRAVRKPHRFNVDASLYEDGREVARGSSAKLLEEPGEFLLRANDRASAEVVASPLKLNLRVVDFSCGRPLDRVEIGFALDRLTEPNGIGSIPVAHNWAGIKEVGSEFEYDLANYYLANGRRYQLRIKVRLADDESAE